jgi:hypothetical protein
MHQNEIRNLTNEKLSIHCREQSGLFRMGEQDNDSRFCLELIRRAVFRVAHADHYFYDVYQPWLQKKIGSMIQGNEDLIADMTQEALLRFFQYVTPQNWSGFEGLPQLLAYLNKCGETSVFAYWRLQNKETLLADFVSVGDNTVRSIEGTISRDTLENQLWLCVKRNCNDNIDYLLAQQLWLYGVKPRELVKRHSDQFTSVTEVYKRKRNLIDRLKRDADCQSLYDVG